MNLRENPVFNLLLIGYIFSKKTTNQKIKRKRSVWVKSCLKNRLYTSEFNNIFAELFPLDIKYWVGVQRGQSYHMGRRCLFSLGWPPF